MVSNDEGIHIVVLACQVVIDRDLQVQLPSKGEDRILCQGAWDPVEADSGIRGYLIAIDLGTTTMVCYLLDRKGQEVAAASALNPQGIYGADVVTRIQAALSGKEEKLTGLVRKGLSDLIVQVCAKGGISPGQVERIALVANPCMQQLLMGISPENLAKVPFTPALRTLERIPAGDIFGICPNGEFLVVPDLSGYVGADTLGCVLSTRMYRQEAVTLMVDIGTNGEMVLGNRNRMIACSAAAGPALEGANIRFGMRGSTGAIDHVTWEEGAFRVHVIAEGAAEGICGSGLIDAVAVMLRQGIINRRGHICQGAETVNGERVCRLTDTVYLTQSDIRQVQLAKGAIAAGIELMANQLGISLADIDQVLLAGAFGSYLDPDSACAIGLLPPVLRKNIRPVGNAAGSGAKLLVCSREQQALGAELCRKIECLELAALPDFSRCFGRHTAFPELTA